MILPTKTIFSRQYVKKFEKKWKIFSKIIRQTPHWLFYTLKPSDVEWLKKKPRTFGHINKIALKFALKRQHYTNTYYLVPRQVYYSLHLFYSFSAPFITILFQLFISYHRGFGTFYRVHAASALSFGRMYRHIKFICVLSTIR